MRLIEVLTRVGTGTWTFGVSFAVHESQNNTQPFEDRNISAVWTAFFMPVSAFSNAGFSLFSESLIPLNENHYFMLEMAFLILVGATGNNFKKSNFIHFFS